MPDTFTPIKNFNPRSREGSDVKMLMSAVEGTISIHAPAKGATFLRMVCKLMLTDFNPRSREGSDSIY